MQSQKTEDPLDLLIRDSARISVAAARVREGKKLEKTALARLENSACEEMEIAPVSITEKQSLPPSGDKHDYVSRGSYWWPDPEKDDGLPYIRHDGERNPECDNFDQPRLKKMTMAVSALSWTWRFTGNDAYAERATQWLRVFFLNEKTRMNPHLQYGQGIPGRCEGRGIGIIDTLILADELIDAVIALRESSALAAAEFNALQSWFEKYLDWLLTSEHGINESKEKNNHGTAYDLQVAVFARFAGRDDLAREILAGVPEHRFIPQIEPDGRQPRELIRTKALGYSTMNLKLYFNLASAAAKLGINLWNFESEDGRCIRRALDWLLPFWKEQEGWPYQQITPFEYSHAYELLQRAAFVYDDMRYETALTELPISSKERAGLRSNLFWNRSQSVSAPK